MKKTIAISATALLVGLVVTRAMIRSRKSKKTIPSLWIVDSYKKSA
jgi:hypothetical protein